VQTPLDLKDYKAPDAFQLLTPEQAAIGLIYVIALACIFEPVLR
jgi:hypothetical protein